jgi:hypothetical protein
LRFNRYFVGIRLIQLKNIRLDARSARDIENLIDRVHRDIDYSDGKVNLIDVREILRLDLQYYRLDDPGIVEEVVHKIKIGVKQVAARPLLLLEAARKFDLNALFLPDRKRIYIDDSVPNLKKRWCESHEIAHSLIPWHAEYMLGDNRDTLSPACHQIIEAEANYGAGRLIFPHETFTAARLSSPMSLVHVQSMARSFGNTLTSTLWRSVEQSGEIQFGIIGAHPYHPREDLDPIEYFISSEKFEQQFSNVTEEEVWSWIRLYCSKAKGGPLGQAEVVVLDVNEEPHIFLVESFSNSHSVLTLGRWLQKKPVQIYSEDFKAFTSGIVFP